MATPSLSPVQKMDSEHSFETEGEPWARCRWNSADSSSHPLAWEQTPTHSRLGLGSPAWPTTSFRKEDKPWNGGRRVGRVSHGCFDWAVPSFQRAPHPATLGGLKPPSPPLLHSITGTWVEDLAMNYFMFLSLPSGNISSLMNCFNLCICFVFLFFCFFDKCDF